MFCSRAVCQDESDAEVILGVTGGPVCEFALWLKRKVSGVYKVDTVLSHLCPALMKA
jgi:imidazoleglycerol phosphate dehydratase HisB